MIDLGVAGEGCSVERGITGIVILRGVVHAHREGFKERRQIHGAGSVIGIRMEPAIVCFPGVVVLGQLLTVQTGVRFTGGPGGGTVVVVEGGVGGQRGVTCHVVDPVVQGVAA